MSAGGDASRNTSTSHGSLPLAMSPVVGLGEELWRHHRATHRLEAERAQLLRSGLAQDGMVMNEVDSALKSEYLHILRLRSELGGFPDFPALDLSLEGDGTKGSDEDLLPYKEKSQLELQLRSESQAALLASLTPLSAAIPETDLAARPGHTVGARKLVGPNMSPQRAKDNELVGSVWGCTPFTALPSTPLNSPPPEGRVERGWGRGFQANQHDKKTSQIYAFASFSFRRVERLLAFGAWRAAVAISRGDHALELTLMQRPLYNYSVSMHSHVPRYEITSIVTKLAGRVDRGSMQRVMLAWRLAGVASRRASLEEAAQELQMCKSEQTQRALAVIEHLRDRCLLSETAIRWHSLTMRESPKVQLQWRCPGCSHKLICMVFNAWQLLIKWARAEKHVQSLRVALCGAQARFVKAQVQIHHDRRCAFASRAFAAWARRAKVLRTLSAKYVHWTEDLLRIVFSQWAEVLKAIRENSVRDQMHSRLQIWCESFLESRRVSEDGRDLQVAFTMWRWETSAVSKRTTHLQNMVQSQLSGQVKLQLESWSASHHTLMSKSKAQELMKTAFLLWLFEHSCSMRTASAIQSWSHSCAEREANRKHLRCWIRSQALRSQITRLVHIACVVLMEWSKLVITLREHALKHRLGAEEASRQSVELHLSRWLDCYGVQAEVAERMSMIHSVFRGWRHIILLSRYRSASVRQAMLSDWLDARCDFSWLSELVGMILVAWSWACLALKWDRRREHLESIASSSESERALAAQSIMQRAEAAETALQVQASQVLAMQKYLEQHIGVQSRRATIVQNEHLLQLALAHWRRHVDRSSLDQQRNMMQSAEVAEAALQAQVSKLLATQRDLQQNTVVQVDRVITVCDEQLLLFTLAHWRRHVDRYRFDEQRKVMQETSRMRCAENRKRLIGWLDFQSCAKSPDMWHLAFKIFLVWAGILATSKVDKLSKLNVTQSILLDVFDKVHMKSIVLALWCHIAAKENGRRRVAALSRDASVGARLGERVRWCEDKLSQAKVASALAISFITWLLAMFLTKDLKRKAQGEDSPRFTKEQLDMCVQRSSRQAAAMEEASLMMCSFTSWSWAYACSREKKTKVAHDAELVAVSKEISLSSHAHCTELVDRLCSSRESSEVEELLSLIVVLWSRQMLKSRDDTQSTRAAYLSSRLHRKNEEEMMVRDASLVGFVLAAWSRDVYASHLRRLRPQRDSLSSRLSDLVVRLLNLEDAEIMHLFVFAWQRSAAKSRHLNLKAECNATLEKVLQVGDDCGLLRVCVFAWHRNAANARQLTLKKENNATLEKALQDCRRFSKSRERFVSHMNHRSLYLQHEQVDNFVSILLHAWDQQAKRSRIEAQHVSETEARRTSGNRMMEMRACLDLVSLKMYVWLSENCLVIAFTLWSHGVYSNRKRQWTVDHRNNIADEIQLCTYFTLWVRLTSVEQKGQTQGQLLAAVEAHQDADEQLRKWLDCYGVQAVVAERDARFRKAFTAWLHAAFVSKGETFLTRWSLLSRWLCQHFDSTKQIDLLDSVFLAWQWASLARREGRRKLYFEELARLQKSERAAFAERIALYVLGKLVSELRYFFAAWSEVFAQSKTKRRLSAWFCRVDASELLILVRDIMKSWLEHVAILREKRLERNEKRQSTLIETLSAALPKRLIFSSWFTLCLREQMHRRQLEVVTRAQINFEAQLLACVQWFTSTSYRTPLFAVLEKVFRFWLLTLERNEVDKRTTGISNYYHAKIHQLVGRLDSSGRLAVLDIALACWAFAIMVERSQVLAAQVASAREARLHRCIQQCEVERESFDALNTLAWGFSLWSHVMVVRGAQKLKMERAAQELAKASGVVGLFRLCTDHYHTDMMGRKKIVIATWWQAVRTVKQHAISVQLQKRKAEVTSLRCRTMYLHSRMQSLDDEYLLVLGLATWSRVTGMSKAQEMQKDRDIQRAAGMQLVAYVHLCNASAEKNEAWNSLSLAMAVWLWEVALGRTNILSANQSTRMKMLKLRIIRSLDTHMRSETLNLTSEVFMLWCWARGICTQERLKSSWTRLVDYTAVQIDASQDLRDERLLVDVLASWRASVGMTRELTLRGQRDLHRVAEKRLLVQVARLRKYNEKVGDFRCMDLLVKILAAWSGESVLSREQKLRLELASRRKAGERLLAYVRQSVESAMDSEAKFLLTGVFVMWTCAMKACREERLKADCQRQRESYLKTALHLTTSADKLVTVDNLSFVFTTWTGLVIEQQRLQHILIVTFSCWRAFAAADAAGNATALTLAWAEEAALEQQVENARRTELIALGNAEEARTAELVALAHAEVACQRSRRFCVRAIEERRLVGMRKFFEAWRLALVRLRLELRDVGLELMQDAAIVNEESVAAQIMEVTISREQILDAGEVAEARLLEVAHAEMRLNQARFQARLQIDEFRQSFFAQGFALALRQMTSTLQCALIAWRSIMPMAPFVVGASPVQTLVAVAFISWRTLRRVVNAERSQTALVHALSVERLHGNQIMAFRAWGAQVLLTKCQASYIESLDQMMASQMSVAMLSSVVSNWMILAISQRKDSQAVEFGRLTRARMAVVESTILLSVVLHGWFAQVQATQSEKWMEALRQENEGCVEKASAMVHRGEIVWMLSAAWALWRAEVELSIQAASLRQQAKSSVVAALEKRPASRYLFMVILVAWRLLVSQTIQDADLAEVLKTLRNRAKHLLASTSDAERTSHLVVILQKWKNLASKRKSARRNENIVFRYDAVWGVAHHKLSVIRIMTSWKMLVSISHQKDLIVDVRLWYSRFRSQQTMWRSWQMVTKTAAVKILRVRSCSTGLRLLRVANSSFVRRSVVVAWHLVARSLEQVRLQIHNDFIERQGRRKSIAWVAWCSVVASQQALLTGSSLAKAELLQACKSMLGQAADCNDKFTVRSFLTMWCVVVQYTHKVNRRLAIHRFKLQAREKLVVWQSWRSIVTHSMDAIRILATHATDVQRRDRMANVIIAVRRSKTAQESKMIMSLWRSVARHHRSLQGAVRHRHLVAQQSQILAMRWACSAAWLAWRLLACSGAQPHPESPAFVAASGSRPLLQFLPGSMQAGRLLDQAVAVSSESLQAVPVSRRIMQTVDAQVMVGMGSLEPLQAPPRPRWLLNPEQTLVMTEEGLPTSSHVTPRSREVAVMTETSSPVSLQVAASLREVAQVATEASSPVSLQVAPSSTEVAQVAIEARSPVSLQVAPSSREVAQVAIEAMSPLSLQVAPSSREVAQVATEAMSPVSLRVAPSLRDVAQIHVATEASSPVSLQVAPSSRDVAQVSVGAEHLTSLPVTPCSKDVSQVTTEEESPISLQIAPSSREAAQVTTEEGSPISLQVAPSSREAAQVMTVADSRISSQQPSGSREVAQVEKSRKDFLKGMVAKRHSKDLLERLVSDHDMSKLQVLLVLWRVRAALHINYNVARQAKAKSDQSLIDLCERVRLALMFGSWRWTATRELFSRWNLSQNGQEDSSKFQQEVRELKEEKAVASQLAERMQAQCIALEAEVEVMDVSQQRNFESEAGKLAEVHLAEAVADAAATRKEFHEAEFLASTIHEELRIVTSELNPPSDLREGWQDEAQRKILEPDYATSEELSEREKYDTLRQECGAIARQLEAEYAEDLLMKTRMEALSMECCSLEERYEDQCGTSEMLEAVVSKLSCEKKDELAKASKSEVCAETAFQEGGVQALRQEESISIAKLTEELTQERQSRSTSAEECKVIEARRSECARVEEIVAAELDASRQSVDRLGEELANALEAQREVEDDARFALEECDRYLQHLRKSGSIDATISKLREELKEEQVTCNAFSTALQRAEDVDAGMQECTQAEEAVAAELSATKKGLLEMKGELVEALATKDEIEDDAKLALQECDRYMQLAQEKDSVDLNITRMRDEFSQEMLLGERLRKESDQMEVADSKHVEYEQMEKVVAVKLSESTEEMEAMARQLNRAMETKQELEEDAKVALEECDMFVRTLREKDSMDAFAATLEEGIATEMLLSSRVAEEREKLEAAKAEKDACMQTEGVVTRALSESTEELSHMELKLQEALEAKEEVEKDAKFALEECDRFIKTMRANISTDVKTAVWRAHDAAEKQLKDTLAEKCQRIELLEAKGAESMRSEEAVLREFSEALSQTQEKLNKAEESSLSREMEAEAERLASMIACELEVAAQELGVNFAPGTTEDAEARQVPVVEAETDSKTLARKPSLSQAANDDGENLHGSPPHLNESEKKHGQSLSEGSSDRISQCKQGVEDVVPDNKNAEDQVNSVSSLLARKTSEESALSVDSSVVLAQTSSKVPSRATSPTSPISPRSPARRIKFASSWAGQVANDVSSSRFHLDLPSAKFEHDSSSCSSEMELPKTQKDAAASGSLDPVVANASDVEGPCSNFQLDLTSSQFGMCKCGFDRASHVHLGIVNQTDLPRGRRASTSSEVATSAFRYSSAPPYATREDNVEIDDYVARPCNDFQLDTTAQQFGMCLCGFERSAHESSAFKMQASVSLPAGRRAALPSDFPSDSPKSSASTRSASARASTFSGPLVYTNYSEVGGNSVPCGNFQLDMSSAQFGMCKCGFDKNAHAKKDLRSRSESFRIFTLAQLKKRKSTGNFSGLDPLRLECFLEEREFFQAFGVNPDQFKKLPHWKQKEAKKAVGIF